MQCTWATLVSARKGTPFSVTAGTATISRQLMRTMVITPQIPHGDTNNRPLAVWVGRKVASLTPHLTLHTGTTTLQHQCQENSLISSQNLRLVIGTVDWLSQCL